jgi:hypothetical protein
MKPKWLKVWKKFRGGVSNPDYIMMHPDDDKQECAENWAEKSPGGHSYGWTVYWVSVDLPPQRWLKNEIDDLQRQTDNMLKLQSLLILEEMKHHVKETGVNERGS